MVKITQINLPGINIAPLLALIFIFGWNSSQVCAIGALTSLEAGCIKRTINYAWKVGEKNKMYLLKMLPLTCNLVIF